MKRSITNYLTGLAMGLSVLWTTAQADEGGAIYTMDNSASGNHVLAFQRGQDGGLSNFRSVATGGAGSGAGLSSQGAVVLSRDGRWLFVCNVGSSEISIMAVSDYGLALSDKTASGGKMPVSLALRDNLLYVLNAGGGAGDTDNVTAFTFDNGKLVALPDSTRALSGDNTGPAQVSFTRDGETVVVTERLTNLIDTFSVGDDGLLAAHKTFQSVGATPFGFDIGRQNQIIVSEAAGSASSYTVSRDGDLAIISGAVPTEQAAPCWLITSHDGRFVYTANAGAGTLSGFEVSHDGSLHLLDADGRTAVTGTGSHPVDMAQSHDGRFLYSLANGNGTINAFRVRPNGALQPVMVVSGIPNSAAGLAAR
jgi:6-phosphogluconolactonase (cycloisomerase 2 family)